MKRLWSVVFLVLGIVSMLSAQSAESDPQVRKAREETEVVNDLGRFFGYVLEMEKSNPKLVLAGPQLEVFYRTMTEIKGMARVEAAWAAKTLEYLELDVLTPDQLLAVDQLAIRREAERAPERGTESGQGKGGGNGSGAIQSYIAGGPFNPIVDETRTIGQGFSELYRSISKRP